LPGYDPGRGNAAGVSFWEEFTNHWGEGRVGGGVCREAVGFLALLTPSANLFRGVCKATVCREQEAGGFGVSLGARCSWQTLGPCERAISLAR